MRFTFKHCAPVQIATVVQNLLIRLIIWVFDELGTLHCHDSGRNVRDWYKCQRNLV